MNTNLLRSVGTVEQDNLIAKLVPTAQTFGVKIKPATGASEAVLVKRGTVLALNSDGTYSVLSSSSGAPAAIVADDVIVEKDANATAVAYRSGNFNRAAVICGGSYELTAANEDALRKYDIIFTDVM